MIWRGDFETGDLSQWGSAQWMAADRIRVVTDPVRQGRYAARFEVRPGDNPLNNGATNQERAELLKSAGEKQGTESFWAWSTFLPADFKPSPGTSWNEITQWHDSVTAYQSQSTIAFKIHAGVNPPALWLVTSGGDRIPGSAGWGVQQYKQDLGPILLGRWDDYVLHVRWSSGADGFVELWRNGLLVVPKQMTATLYTDSAAGGVYVKQGLYRQACSVVSVLYHDGMRLGSSYAEVTGDTTTPPPPPPPPPVLAVTQSLTDGAILRGQVSWTAVPSEPVTRVEFLIDGQLWRTEYAAPYGDAGPLDTTTLPDGQHNLTVRATATDGRAAQATVTVAVDNVADDPCAALLASLTKVKADREAAVAELKQTKTGFVNRYWTVPPDGTHWQKALAFLEEG